MSIEYAYEVSLVPYIQDNTPLMRRNPYIFFKVLSSRVVTFLTGHDPKIDITRPVMVNSGQLPRIVHLITWLGGVGGAPRLILNIANGLSDKYTMEGITLSDAFSFKYTNFPVTHCASPRETIEQLKLINPDVLHVYYYGDWSGFHKHFESILEFESRYKIIMNLLVPIHVYRSEKIDHYVYCSKYIQDIQYVNQQNETVIYPGIDTFEFRPTVNRVHPYSVGMVYRLWNDKIDESTIEIFIELAKRKPNLLIYIIGSGINFHHYVTRARQENVRRQIQFVGEVGYNELPHWYDQFGVFVAPVHTESFGMVVPYAMAKQIPVVAYRRGALEEILGSTNVLVNTAPEMISAICELLDDPRKAYEVTIGSKERVEINFSMPLMLKKYDELYQSLI